MAEEQTSEREGPTPDELCEELCTDFESVEITEDETEFLLQEALSLNKRLKAELQRKSRPGGGTASSFDSALDGPLAAKPPRHGGKGGRTLPPLKNAKLHGASSKSGSSKKSQKGKKLPSDRATLSAGSINRKPSASRGKPSRGSRSADNRPEWNDRFSV